MNTTTATSIEATFTLERRENQAVFLTPSELCQRWKIHSDTLAKVDLPWFRPRPRCRLIALAFIETYERTHGWSS